MLQPLLSTLTLKQQALLEPNHRSLALTSDQRLWLEHPRPKESIQSWPCVPPVQKSKTTRRSACFQPMEQTDWWQLPLLTTIFKALSNVKSMVKSAQDSHRLSQRSIFNRSVLSNYHLLQLSKLSLHCRMIESTWPFKMQRSAWWTLNWSSSLRLRDHTLQPSRSGVLPKISSKDQSLSRHCKMSSKIGLNLPKNQAVIRHRELSCIAFTTQLTMIKTWMRRSTQAPRMIKSCQK